MTDKRRLREYLLGGLAPMDAEALEERMFSDDALHEEMVEEHEALVEEYVAKSLMGEDAARFEVQRNQSPELALKVAELQDLTTLLARGRERGSGRGMSTRFSSRTLPAVMAVGLLGVMLAFCIQWRENWRLRAELSRRVEEPRATSTATPEQAARAESFIFLAAGVMRGPQNVPRVEFAPGAAVVQLQIEVHEDAASPKSWAVEVSRDGQEIFRCASLFARRVGSTSYLPVYVPIEALPEGYYSVRVQSSDSRQGSESRTFMVGRA